MQREIEFQKCFDMISEVTYTGMEDGSHMFHIKRKCAELFDDEEDDGKDEQSRCGAEEGLVVVHGRRGLEQRPALMVSTMPLLRSSRTNHAVSDHNIGIAHRGHHSVVNLQHPHPP